MATCIDTDSCTAAQQSQRQERGKGGLVRALARLAFGAPEEATGRSWRISSRSLRIVHRFCGEANDNASMFGGQRWKGGVYGMRQEGREESRGREKVCRHSREACGAPLPHLRLPPGSSDTCSSIIDQLQRATAQKKGGAAHTVSWGWLIDGGGGGNCTGGIGGLSRCAGATGGGTARLLWAQRRRSSRVSTMATHP